MYVFVCVINYMLTMLTIVPKQILDISLLISKVFVFFEHIIGKQQIKLLQ